MAVGGAAVGETAVGDGSTKGVPLGADAGVGVFGPAVALAGTPVAAGGGVTGVGAAGPQAANARIRPAPNRKALLQRGDRKVVKADLGRRLVKTAHKQPDDAGLQGGIVGRRYQFTVGI
jgi:hypothetical protein